MTHPPEAPRVTANERTVLLSVALGDFGPDWIERVEYRFVHKETGQVANTLDTRVHGSARDWRVERRTVIATRWEESR